MSAGPGERVRMSHSDAFTRQMERMPLLRSTVVMVAMLDAVPGEAAVRTAVRRATRAIPLLRATLHPGRTGRPTWRPGGDVDLDWHVQRVALPGGGTRAQLMALASRTASAAFDPARPLWEITTVEGLADGAAAVVMKFHHAITDGIGGIALAVHLFDLDPAGPAPVGEPAPLVAGDAPAPLRGRVAARVRSLRADPRASLVGTARTALSVAKVVAPLRTTFSPVMRDRGLARSFGTLDVPLSALREAAHAAGGKLNDAFLAGITGGLREYHRTHGISVDRLRVSLPISLRRPEDPLGGNRITLVRFPVDAATEDPAVRMRATRDQTEAWRAEPALPHTQRIAAGLNLLPSAAVGTMLTHVDFLASNVPGFPVPVQLAGERLLGFYPFGPTVGAAMNLTLMSYADTCCIGVNSDDAAVPDPDVLRDCLERGFDEVLAVR